MNETINLSISFSPKHAPPPCGFSIKTCCSKQQRKAEQTGERYTGQEILGSLVSVDSTMADVAAASRNQSSRRLEASSLPGLSFIDEHSRGVDHRAESISARLGMDYVPQAKLLSRGGQEAKQQPALGRRAFDPRRSKEESTSLFFRTSLPRDRRQGVEDVRLRRTGGQKEAAVGERERERVRPNKCWIGSPGGMPIAEREGERDKRRRINNSARR